MTTTDKMQRSRRIRCRIVSLDHTTTFVINGDKSAYQFGYGNDWHGTTEADAIERFDAWRATHADDCDIIYADF